MQKQRDWEEKQKKKAAEEAEQSEKRIPLLPKAMGTRPWHARLRFCSFWGWTFPAGAHPSISTLAEVEVDGNQLQMALQLRTADIDVALTTGSRWKRTRKSFANWSDPTFS